MLCFGRAIPKQAGLDHCTWFRDKSVYLIDEDPNQKRSQLTHWCGKENLELYWINFYWCEGLLFRIEDSSYLWLFFLSFQTSRENCEYDE